jgi:hypothetical protein
MRLRQFTIIILGIGFSLAVLSNSGGRASTAGQGNTGAPGDQSLGGQPLTCASSSCHGIGSPTGLQAGLTIDLFDLDGNPVGSDGYMAGQMYEARVSVEVLSGSPSGYGFQLVCLNGETGQNAGSAGTWSDPAANVKIAGANGRSYAEHNGVSNSNVFSVMWTAPVQNAETVSFYACGNAVNNNGNSGGDAGACATLEVSRNTTTSVIRPADIESSLAVFPNPVSHQATLSITVRESGTYALSLFSTQGTNVKTDILELKSGENQLNVSVDNQDAGVWYWHLRNLSEGNISVTRMVVVD